MNNSVIVNHRIRLNGFQLLGIKLLDVPCLQPSQGVALLAEIRLDYAFHHSFVRSVCGDLYTHLYDIQPLQQIIRKWHIRV